MTTRERPHDEDAARNGSRLAPALVLTAVVAAGALACGSASSAASAPPAAPPKARYAGQLSLAVSLPSNLTAGDKAATAKFALTNNGSATFNGCFGPAWGISVIVDGHDAGGAVTAAHPKCEETLTLLPRQTIVWSKRISLHRLEAGQAKVTGWVRLVDPATCDPSQNCRDVSVASPMGLVSVGEKR